MWLIPVRFLEEKKSLEKKNDRIFSFLSAFTIYMCAFLIPIGFVFLFFSSSIFLKMRFQERVPAWTFFSSFLIRYSTYKMHMWTDTGIYIYIYTLDPIYIKSARNRFSSFFFIRPDMCGKYVPVDMWQNNINNNRKTK